MNTPTEKSGVAGAPQRRGAWLWRRPRSAWLLGIPFGALLALLLGVACTGGVVGAVGFASSDRFCTSCHVSAIPEKELLASSHGANKFGVRSRCADCHVPRGFVAASIKHLESSAELWTTLTGKLDTPAKYESHRLAMAQKVWKEMKANDSSECRACHGVAHMVAVQGSPAASAATRTSAAISPAATHQALAPGYTCIDCHKGIVHALPSPMVSKG